MQPCYGPMASSAIIGRYTAGKVVVFGRTVTAIKKDNPIAHYSLYVVSRSEGKVSSFLRPVQIN